MKLLLVAAAASQAFNLNCSGDLHTTMIGVDRTEDFEKTFRVDLDAGKWCENECRVVRDFYEVAPTQLTFTKMKSSSGFEQEEVTEFVDRETGEFFAFSGSRSRSLGPVALTWRGKCEKADFTGWPEFKTQF